MDRPVGTRLVSLRPKPYLRSGRDRAAHPGRSPVPMALGGVPKATAHSGGWLDSSLFFTRGAHDGRAALGTHGERLGRRLRHNG